MLIDSHCHIFTNQIVKNVSSKSALVELLKLNVAYASHCLDPKVLESSAVRNKIDICVLLPTVAPNKYGWKMTDISKLLQNHLN